MSDGLPGIGDRVVHKLTKGRVRGVVQSIHIHRDHTMMVVKVDNTTVPDMNYRADNLVLEKDWKE